MAVVSDLTLLTLTHDGVGVRCTIVIRLLFGLGLALAAGRQEFLVVDGLEKGITGLLLGRVLLVVDLAAVAFVVLVGELVFYDGVRVYHVWAQGGARTKIGNGARAVRPLLKVVLRVVVVVRLRVTYAVRLRVNILVADTVKESGNVGGYAARLGGA